MTTAEDLIAAADAHSAHSYHPLPVVVTAGTRGENGVVVPPEGHLPAVREPTRERNVLFVPARSGRASAPPGGQFACEHEGVVPDM